LHGIRGKQKPQPAAIENPKGLPKFPQPGTAQLYKNFFKRLSRLAPTNTPKQTDHAAVALSAVTTRHLSSAAIQSTTQRWTQLTDHRF
jgi:uncharacterized protein (DUF2267 family)